MDKIKEILSNVEIEPTSGCWETLRNRLEACMPQAPTQGSATDTPLTQAAASSRHAIKAVIVKSVATVLGTSALAGAITFAVLHKSEEHTTEMSALQTTQMETTATETVSVEAEHAFDANPPVRTDIAGKETAYATPNDNIPQSAELVKVCEDIHPVTLTPEPQVIAMPSTGVMPIVAEPNVPAHAQQETAAHNDAPSDNVEQSDNASIEFTIPNVFTPNGDGVNDLFVIKGIEQCTQRQLTVSDNAGHIVFRANMYNNDWDGHSCPDGVYHYQLRYIYNGVSKFKSGTLTILRR